MDGWLVNAEECRAKARGMREKATARTFSTNRGYLGLMAGQHDWLAEQLDAEEGRR
jgi:hypothetical protein